MRSGVALLLFTATLALAPQPRAEEAGLVEFRALHPDLAAVVVRATVAFCRDRGHQVAAAVVDRAGVPQALLRDVHAGPHTVDAAILKARTAVSFRTDTLALVERTRAGEVDAGVHDIPGVLVLGGGVLIEAGGSIVGAVGVSGGPSGEADTACARAGLEAIAGRVPF